MSWRRGAYVISGIAAAGLLAELAWWVLDPKGDVHLIDRTVRVLDALREVARI